MHQLQTMALYPCQWRATHSTTHTYTHRQSHTHTHTHTHTQTQTYKLWSSCISTPFMDNKRLSERVCSHSVCVCAQTAQTKHDHTHTVVCGISGGLACVCVVCVRACFCIISSHIVTMSHEYDFQLYPLCLLRFTV